MKSAFARELREKRMIAGMTQGELADLQGVSRITISLWERDIVKPRPNAYRRLVQTIGLDPSVIVRSDGAVSV